MDWVIYWNTVSALTYAFEHNIPFLKHYMNHNNWSERCGHYYLTLSLFFLLLPVFTFLLEGLYQGF